MTIADILTIYEGSNGDATKALYAELEKHGPIGIVALNLFRANKNSARAKVYRGGIRGKGSYRAMAYDRKQWAIDNLVDVLTAHAEALGIVWGWRIDEKQEFHRNVLYVEAPTGQISFHVRDRGKGPDYAKEWDGVRGASPQRACSFCAKVLEGVMV
ncbi:hypothetical protein KFK14_12710 [Sphingobium phenoxybenzoativorans]|uniref:Uncharacterized protein n=1 Tax=Sphingobium phenoxybenzoativorans TaxID=1592790 RepID=A0A975K3S5_9SPHN|nr:hypothetical protein [Sphingobium phenoxybenzoativorans]QUT04007.1 hypothetical protein KFK14_12710 [Sphingobium phenoxybenzoativorans]